MANSVHITVELKKQSELDRFCIVALFNEHTILIKSLLKNLFTKPLRDKGNLQVAAVSVVGHGTEIHDTVRIERAGLAFGAQADTDCAGDSRGVA